MLSPIEREVASNGKWFLTRMRLYRTAGGQIGGVVATFVDITQRLIAEKDLKTSEARARLLLQELSHRVKKYTHRCAIDGTANLQGKCSLF